MLLFQAAITRALLSQQKSTATIVKENGEKVKVDLPDIKIAATFGKPVESSFLPLKSPAEGKEFPGRQAMQLSQELFLFNFFP